MPKPLTLAELSKIIAAYLPGVDLTPHTALADLPIDSLDRLEIALQIEVLTDIDTPTEAEQYWSTVQDILNTYSA